jgi:hypothetical protein
VARYRDAVGVAKAATAVLTAVNVLGGATQENHSGMANMKRVSSLVVATEAMGEHHRLPPGYAAYPRIMALKDRTHWGALAVNGLGREWRSAGHTALLRQGFGEQPA